MAMLGGAAACAAQRPHVLLVTADGLGAAELAACGQPQLKTPHLDRLRAAGMDFRRAIGAPGRVAGRVQLLAGRHEFECGVSHSLAGRNLIRPDLRLLPDHFAKAGYHTAIIGRWGLGEAFPHRPEDRGFAEWCVIGGNEPGSLSDAWGNTYRNLQVRTPAGWEAREGDAGKVWSAATRAVLSARAAAGKPFFLWLSFTPVADPASPTAVRRAMIEDLDARLGEVLGTLDTLGLASSTVVVFTSGHGPPGGDALSVPAIVRWPGRIAAMGVSDALVSQADLCQTLLSLSGVGAGAVNGDGRDFSGFLLGTAPVPEDRPCFSQGGGWPGDERPERHRSVDFSVRKGHWLLRGTDLFDLAADPDQRTNLFTQRPEVAIPLLTAYGTWWNRVLPSLRTPVRYAIGDDRQTTVRLNASEWWPSRDVPSVNAPEPPATQSGARIILTALAAGTAIPETRGLWKIQVVRDGHYRITVAMIPGTAPSEEINRLGQLKAGEVCLRVGRSELRMPLAKGATSATLGVDLSAGEMDLEAWFTGQLPDGRILGALFADITREGDRRRPDLQLDFHTVPKK